MADPTSIVTAITAIKNSMDVIKAVKDADYDLDKAILKEKIAALVDSLMEEKIEAMETLDIIHGKDEEIRNLKNVLEENDKITQAKNENLDLIEKYRESVIKILKLLDKKIWKLESFSIHENLTWDFLCEETNEKEITVRVILDALVEEKLLEVKPGEHSFNQIQTTSKCRRFLFKYEK